MADRLHWYQCPCENLADMVGFLNPKKFRTFLIEPGIDDAEKLTARYFPNASDYDTIEIYNMLVRAYDVIHRIAFKLSQFGDSLAEIRNNLTLHVCECRDCDREYSGMIDRRLEEELSKLGERFPDFERSLKPKQIGQMRKRIDKKYLDLTSFF